MGTQLMHAPCFNLDQWGI